MAFTEINGVYCIEVEAVLRKTSRQRPHWRFVGGGRRRSGSRCKLCKVVRHVHSLYDAFKRAAPDRQACSSVPLALKKTCYGYSRRDVPPYCSAAGHTFPLCTEEASVRTPKTHFFFKRDLTSNK